MRLVLNEITKEFKGTTVLRNISMEVHGGIVCGIQGINGSGKTMLLRVMAGLLIPTNGTIYFENDLREKKTLDNCNIGALIEKPAFLDFYTGLQNLKLLASIRGNISEKEIYEVLKRVNLDFRDKRKFKKYSMGMKQKLGIASAIMEKPSIILLDEPTNGLDFLSLNMLEKIICEEKSRGAIVVITSHDIKFLERCCEKVYDIQQGNITAARSIYEEKII